MLSSMRYDIWDTVVPVCINCIQCAIIVPIHVHCILCTLVYGECVFLCMYTVSKALWYKGYDCPYASYYTLYSTCYDICNTVVSVCDFLEQSLSTIMVSIIWPSQKFNSDAEWIS